MPNLLEQYVRSRFKGKCPTKHLVNEILFGFDLSTISTEHFIHGQKRNNKNLQ